MITVTVFKSIDDQNNNRNPKVYKGKTPTEIYQKINKEIAHKIPDFYAWNNSVKDGARMAPMLGVWD